MERLIPAAENDYELLCRFYEEVCAAQAEDPSGPQWHYGIYPCREDIREHIARGEQYMVRRDGQLAAAMVLIREEDEMYREASWTVKEEPIWVVHLFAVHPAFRGQGLAKEALRALLSAAGEKNVRAIHLDVVKGNVPAETLYQKLGFGFVEEREVFYEDTGDIAVRLYEYSL